MSRSSACTPRASGALHWGLEDDGPDDVFTGAVDGQVARYYCLRDDGCPCPTGMHRVEGRDVLDAAVPAATLTFFGDYEGAESAPDPQVEVAALSMAEAAPELCTDDIHIEFTVCETWASHEELLATVPGGTHVTGPQDVGAPEGPWACLWHRRRPAARRPDVLRMDRRRLAVRGRPNRPIRRGVERPRRSGRTGQGLHPATSRRRPSARLCQPIRRFDGRGRAPRRRPPPVAATRHARLPGAAVPQRRRAAGAVLRHRLAPAAATEEGK